MQEDEPKINITDQDDSCFRLLCFLVRIIAPRRRSVFPGIPDDAPDAARDVAVADGFEPFGDGSRNGDRSANSGLVAGKRGTACSFAATAPTGFFRH